jgi:hypothetical protein
MPAIGEKEKEKAKKDKLTVEVKKLCEQLCSSSLTNPPKLRPIMKQRPQSYDTAKATNITSLYTFGLAIRPATTTHMNFAQQSAVY